MRPHGPELGQHTTMVTVHRIADRMGLHVTPAQARAVYVALVHAGAHDASPLHPGLNCLQTAAGQDTFIRSRLLELHTTPDHTYTPTSSVYTCHTRGRRVIRKPLP